MSDVNKRLLKTIETSAYDENIKDLLKQLLLIELKNFNDNNPKYSEDYDRIIKKLVNYEDETNGIWLCSFK